MMTDFRKLRLASATVRPEVDVDKVFIVVFDTLEEQALFSSAYTGFGDVHK